MIIALFIAPSLFGAEPWAQFRGPRGDGHTTATNLPVEWSETKNVAWKTAIHDRGYSSPVIYGKQVWLTTATEDGKKLFGLCIDKDTGKVLHDLHLFDVAKPQRITRDNTYASPTPVIEKGRVFLHFGTYGTACINTETYEERWRREDLNCDHMEGPGSSPILVGELLVFHVDGGDVQYVTALDKRTGETVWRTDRSIDLSKMQKDIRKAFCTPIVAELDGVEVLVSPGAHAAMAYDVRTGEEKWRVRYKGFSLASRPMFDGERVYIATGFMRAQLYAVDFAGSGDVTDEAVAWKWRRNVPKMPSPLLLGDRVFMVDDNGYATCLDTATGEAVWRQRLGGEHCSTPLCVGDRIYFFDREGRTVVLARADEYRVLAENHLDAGFMASPAVVGDALLLRTKTHLYRIEAPQ